jgi:hypothetical protein
MGRKKFVVEPEAKGPLRRSRCRRKSSIKMCFEEMGGDSVDWINLAWG